MKIYLYTDLTRLPSNAKVQVASGQGSHWLIESPTICHLCITRPSEIFVNFVFNIIHAEYLHNMQIICSFIVLCENEYFPISNIH